MEALILSIVSAAEGFFDIMAALITGILAQPLLLLAVSVGIIGVGISLFRRLVRG